MNGVEEKQRMRTLEPFDKCPEDILLSVYNLKYVINVWSAFSEAISWASINNLKGENELNAIAERYHNDRCMHWKNV
jgi:hypothetical protein